MSSVILTHRTKCLLYRYFNRQRLDVESFLTIEVIFDKTYTISFHEKIPWTSNDNIQYFERTRYIRDITYFPNALLDAIKLMHMHDPIQGSYCTSTVGCGFRLRGTDPRHSQKPVYSEVFRRYSNPPKFNSPGDNLFDGLSEIFTKIKTEHEKKQIDDMKTSEETAVEQRKINEKLSDDLKMSEAIAIVQHNINEKLTDDLKTSEETVAELRKINERLAILIDGEKLKKSLLSKKLSDITDLYKALLSTTACKQGQ
mgnify:CR=1 FL=1